MSREKQITMYLNMYPVPQSEGGTYVGQQAPSRALADQVAEPHRIACVEVKWRKGEGL